jgi:hypothetical protein
MKGISIKTACSVRRKNMNCTLCDKPIIKYDPSFNHLKVDESHAAEICPECFDKIVKWQQEIFARLFPTSAAKKKYGKT